MVSADCDIQRCITFTAAASELCRPVAKTQPQIRYWVKRGCNANRDHFLYWLMCWIFSWWTDFYTLWHHVRKQFPSLQKSWEITGYPKLILFRIIGSPFILASDLIQHGFFGGYCRWSRLLCKETAAICRYFNSEIPHLLTPALALSLFRLV